MQAQEISNENRAAVRSILLFYTYLVPDEKVGLQLAKRTWKRLSREGEGSHIFSQDDQAKVVSITKRLFDEWRDSKSAHNFLIQQSGKMWSTHVPLDLWREFQKNADRETLTVVVWSMILNFSDAAIAQGLGVTVGTVRFRVSRGLRLLAELKGMEA